MFQLQTLEATKLGGYRLVGESGNNKPIFHANPAVLLGEGSFQVSEQKNPRG